MVTQNGRWKSLIREAVIREKGQKAVERFGKEKSIHRIQYKG